MSDLLPRLLSKSASVTITPMCLVLLWLWKLLTLLKMKLAMRCSLLLPRWRGRGPFVVQKTETGLQVLSRPVRNEPVTIHPLTLSGWTEAGGWSLLTTACVFYMCQSPSQSTSIYCLGACTTNTSVRGLFPSHVDVVYCFGQ